MAIATIGTFLMHGTTSGSSTTYTKLCDISSFGDLGGEAERIDVTTLTNKNRAYIAGVQDQQTITFSAFFNRADYAALKALEHKQELYAVYFGSTESNGVLTPDETHADKFKFTGELSTFVPGGGVNEAVGMTVNIIPSTDVTFEAGSSS